LPDKICQGFLKVVREARDAAVELIQKSIKSRQNLCKAGRWTKPPRRVVEKSRLRKITSFTPHRPQTSARRCTATGVNMDGLETHDGPAI